MTYAKAKDILTKGVIDSPIRKGLSAQKSYDLLILEKSTIRDISIAYNTARDEIAKELKARYDQLVGNIANMTPGQIEMAQIKLLRDAQLYENLETRIGQLGGKLDKINSAAILEASGISNEYVKNELEALSFFTNLDPANFARINTLQAELTVNHVNQGTKFVTAAQQAEILPQIQQQIRIGILKGESIENITARIVSKTPLTLAGVNKGVFSTIEQRARLNARWGIIESSSAAAVTQYGAFNTRCAENDIKVQVKKQVIAQIDDRTTVTCLYAHGQIQEIEKPFETDQGLLDYTPFHCNCRSTVAAWHELFESFGKSTKQMQAESQKELNKRAAAKANKKGQGKLFSNKQIAKQKSQAAIGEKAIKATTKTIPQEMEMPPKELSERIMKLPSNEAVKILDMPTNAQREKGIIDVQKRLAAEAKKQAGKLKPFQEMHADVGYDVIEGKDILIKKAAKQGYKIDRMDAINAIDGGLKQYCGTYNCKTIRSAQEGFMKKGKWVTESLQQQSKNLENFVKWSYDFDERQMLFRSIRDHGDDYLKMLKGDTVDMFGTSSWTTDSQWSYSMFGAQDEPIFILKGGASKGMSASTQGYMGTREQEVLISMKQKYKLVSKPVKMAIKDIPELQELAKSELYRTAHGAELLSRLENNVVVVYLEAI